MAESNEIPGARVPIPPSITAESFDLAHGVMAPGDIMARMAREAYSDEYPEEVDPYGMSTFWTLRTFVRELRLPTDGTLVDIACGRAGVSLWIARETGADLIGVDWSPVGVAAAAERAHQWVGDGRARFQVGDLVATGLPDECADAVLCASIFHYGQHTVGEAKATLAASGVTVRR